MQIACWLSKLSDARPGVQPCNSGGIIRPVILRLNVSDEPWFLLEPPGSSPHYKPQRHAICNRSELLKSSITSFPGLACPNKLISGSDAGYPQEAPIQTQIHDPPTTPSAASTHDGPIYFHRGAWNCTAFYHWASTNLTSNTMIQHRSWSASVRCSSVRFISISDVDDHLPSEDGLYPERTSSKWHAGIR